MRIQETSDCQVAFGKWIKEARERKDLRQLDVAEMADIKQSYYSMIENGQRNVDLNLAIRICQILKLDIGDFTKRYTK